MFILSSTALHVLWRVDFAEPEDAQILHCINPCYMDPDNPE